MQPRGGGLFLLDSGRAHAFLAQLVNRFLGVLHRLFGLGGLGFTLGDAGVPLGLLGQATGFVIVLVVHGDFGLLELVLGRLHFHGGELGAAGADCAVDGRLGHGVLLGRWVAGAARRTKLVPIASAASLSPRRW